jgi:hypothetical protein
MNIGESGHSHAERLNSNASNLPSVLHTISNERGDVYDKLIGHLREVFPTVGNVRVRTKPENNNLEVRVWPTQAMERVELSFPLKASGTGVSQVLAILTALLTVTEAVIVIDEINSFLHPAAVKTLLRIIQTQYTENQYIISTHSPEVISHGNASSIHLVKRSGYESTVTSVDLTKIENLRQVGEDLGVSVSDVFAAERLIWVEGPTEERCFPFIHNSLVGPVPAGTVFSSVVATGDFNSKKRNPTMVFEIYRRLSTAVATLPVSVLFSFDAETLTESEKEDIARSSNGCVRFLPRRHIECYLVDPTAIASFITSQDAGSSSTVTTDVVSEKISVLAATDRFRIPNWTGNLEDVGWLSAVDAANLIAAVCAELSQHRVVFRKKADTLYLVQHLVTHNPKFLRPLADYVESLSTASMAG